MREVSGPEEQTITFSLGPRHDLTLAARAWGAAEDEAQLRVLALHGWMDNAASFDRLAPLILRGLRSSGVDAARIVALDFPGHGRSEHRGHGTYHLIDYVADVAAALETLGWSRCVLMGHSLGAGVAALTAGALPDRVERLVQIEGLGPLTNAADAAPEVLREALAAEARRRGRAGGGRAFATVDQAVEARLAVTVMDEGSARLLVTRAIREDEDGLRWRSDPRLRLRSRVRLTEAQVLAFLREIQCPTLLVRAEEGMSFPEEVGRARLAAIRELRVARLAGHHHLHLDRPEPVAAEIAAFLAEGRSPASS